MTADILDAIDGVVAEAEQANQALAESFFAEAMAGVRDAIDGDVSDDVCHCGYCGGDPDQANWSPPENRETRSGSWGDHWIEMGTTTEEPWLTVPPALPLITLGVWQRAAQDEFVTMFARSRPTPIPESLVKPPVPQPRDGADLDWVDRGVVTLPQEPIMPQMPEPSWRAMVSTSSVNRSIGSQRRR